jgi:hypothetical protein
MSPRTLAYTSSGRRRSAAARLGWIIVGRRVVVVGPQTTRNGVVAIDPHTTQSGVAWDHSLAGTNDDCLTSTRYLIGVMRSMRWRICATRSAILAHLPCWTRPKSSMPCAGRLAAFCLQTSVLVAVSRHIWCRSAGSCWHRCPKTRGPLI